MPDPEKKPEGKKGEGNSLTKKLGPLPGWAWVGIGGVAIWIFMSRGGGRLGGGGGQFAQPGQGGGGGAGLLDPTSAALMSPSGVVPGFLGGGGTDPVILPPALAFSAPAPVYSFFSVTPQAATQGIPPVQQQATVPVQQATIPVGYAPSGLTYASPPGVPTQGITGPVPGTPFQGLFAPSLASTPAAPQYVTPQYASTITPAAPGSGFGPGAQVQTLSSYGLPTQYSLSADAIARGGIPANQVPTAVFMPNTPAASSAPGGGYWGPNNINLPKASVYNAQGQNAVGAARNSSGYTQADRDA